MSRPRNSSPKQRRMKPTTNTKQRYHGLEGKNKLLLSSMEALSRDQYDYLDHRYVVRTQKCVPEKFTELCHMHLAFLLDLSGNKLELLLSSTDDSSSHKKKRAMLTSAAASVFKKKEKVSTGLFGAALSDEGVCLMMPLIKFLEDDKNVCKEGLFRKPGNRSRMNALRESLNMHGPAAALKPDVFSAHDVAGVLKEFLRELPEPVLTDSHMEAHRQIQEMGQHAKDMAGLHERYTKKKLSALQLLFLLLPSATRLMILKVLRLLHKVGQCPETKMTPTTLGTIFAPIFFLSRKVDASEMCSAITQTEPALAFMIEHAHELRKAPNELIVDLANFWTSEKTGSPLKSEMDSGDVPKLKKSTSGRTLHTTICYIDREAARSEDVASNTQAELDNLFQLIQALPDTPHNRRIKKNMMKGTVTPQSASTKQHHGSRSIGASIKKRLPSLMRSRTKRGMSQFGACSSTSTSSMSSVESQVPAPSMSDLLQSPATTHSGGYSRPSRLQHKRSHCEEGSSAECTSPKMMSADDTADTADFQSPGSMGSPTFTSPTCSKRKSPKLRSADDTADTADFQSPGSMRSPSYSSPSSSLSSSVGSNYSLHAEMMSHTEQPITDGRLTPDEDESSNDAGSISPPYPRLTAQISSPLLDNVTNAAEMNNNSISDSTPIVFCDENAKPMEDFTSENSLPRQGSMSKKAQSPLTPSRKVLQDNENICAGQSKKPVQKADSKSFNAPVTPIMPRALLRLAHCDLLETSL